MCIQKQDWECFEDEVHGYVEQLVKGYRLLINPNKTKLFRNKGYYSEARKSEIKFEIAIEAYDEGATEASLVWVWECKDKSKSGRYVEVEDVEVLQSKIQQLGAGRFKRSMVTTHGFQSAATELAKTVGISLFVVQKQLVRITKFAEGSSPEGDLTLIFHLPFLQKFSGQRCTDLPGDALIQLPFREFGLLPKI